MATAQAKQLNQETGRKVCIVGRRGVPQWQDIFENNPRIARIWTRNTVRLINGPGLRPYIAQKTPTKWYWKTWDIKSGEIFLSEAEKHFADPYGGRVLIEPNTKVEASNKSWLWERWQELVSRFPHETFIQVGPASGRRLEGPMFVETPTFRHACAVLAVSRAFVGSEGGLHHSAAAFNQPAVVLFGGFISPEVTGYPTHRNLFTGSGLGCGTRTISCQHCREAMAAITVDEVEKNLKEIL